MQILGTNGLFFTLFLKKKRKNLAKRDTFLRRKRKIFKEVSRFIVMFGLFSNKKEVRQIKEETQRGFENVKKDISSISGWIKHLDSEKELQKRDVSEIKEILSSIQEEVEGLKNIISIMNELKPKKVFKTSKQMFQKQTGVYAVQTGVQTGVQTPNLSQFSITERAILWVLLNTDMKLGYEDLAAILGKEKSTIRGQINRIKQKSEGLLEEIIEGKGKKRIYIPEETKENLLKKSKVRVKDRKKPKKKKKNQISIC